MNTHSSPMISTLPPRRRGFFPQPIPVKRLLRRASSISIAFLPAGFDEQLVIDSIEYSVERVFLESVRASGYCLKAVERIIGF